MTAAALSRTYINNSSVYTSSSQIWINSSTTSNTTAASSAVMVVDQNINPQNLNKQLHTAGLFLGDGKTLQYENGEIVLLQTHTDGSTTSSVIPKKHRGVIDLKSRVLDLTNRVTIRLPDGGVVEIDKHGKVTKETYINASEKCIDVLDGNTALYESLAFCHFRDIKIPAGANTKATFVLPNDVKIHLFADDHIEIDEADRTQLYRSESIRDFNKYLNASDLLEEFIEYCAKQRLTKHEFSELPISLFIYWLIVKAAEADGDPVDEVQPLLTYAVKDKKVHKHRCKCCGKYLSKKFEFHGVNFCSTEHMTQHMTQEGL